MKDITHMVKDVKTRTCRIFCTELNEHVVIILPCNISSARDFSFVLPAQPYSYWSSQLPICPFVLYQSFLLHHSQNLPPSDYFTWYITRISYPRYAICSCSESPCLCWRRRLNIWFRIHPISIGNNWDECEGDSMRDRKKGINKSRLKEILN